MSGLSAPTRAAPERPVRALDCDIAADIAHIALQSHVTHRELTPRLMGRMLERFETRLGDLYGYLMTESELAGLKADVARADRKRLAKALMNGDCSFFETQAARVTRGLIGLRESFDDLDSLTLKLVGLPDSDAPPTLPRDKAIANLRRQVESWRERIPVTEAARFVAKRYLRALEKLEERLPRLAYETLLGAFTSALDPHSDYVPERDAGRARAAMKRSFTGIGILLQEHPLGTQIEEVVKDGPADRDGRVRAQQFIVAVDGKPTALEDLDSVGALIRGKPGTQVTLTIAELDESGTLVRPRQVRLARGEIPRKATSLSAKRYRAHGKNVVVARLGTFYPGAASDLASEILRLKGEAPIDALVLDLRDNPGGLVSEAQRILGIFVGDAHVMATQRREGPPDESYDTLGMPRLFEGAVVVAVNQGSASASEIVAGSLAGLDRAIVAGSPRTYGKGSMQLVYDRDRVAGMPGTLKLTEATYFTSLGDSPQCVGVEADIVVPGPLGLPDSERECAASKYPLAAASLRRPIWRWKEYLAAHDKGMRYRVPGLKAASLARTAGMPAPGPEKDAATLSAASRAQLEEIVRIAAESARMAETAR